MAEHVIVVLEVVDVDQQQGQRVLVAAGTVHFQLELGEKVPRVEKAGEPVGDGQLLQLFHHPVAFQGECPLPQHPPHPQQEFLQPDRFDHEVAGADADGPFIGKVVAVAGHHDHVRIVLFLDELGELEAAQTGQNNVGDDEVEQVGAEQIQGILGAGDRLGDKAGEPHVLAHGVPDFGFVVDDEDPVIHD